MRIDDLGWLVPESDTDPKVIRLESKRTSALATNTPLGIVWHYTAGPCKSPDYAENLARHIAAFDPKTDRRASWHVVIAKDGRMFQSVRFLRGAWHVKGSGRIAGTDRVINHSTVGIELENAGRLMRIGTVNPKFYCWPYFIDPQASPQDRRLNGALEVAPERAESSRDGFFDRFEPAQIQSAEALLYALVGQYGWAPSVCTYGHCDFTNLKEDPGPLWKNLLPSLVDRVFAKLGAICPPSG